ncbi:MAG: hypothetical protein ACI9QQ_002714, partial [Myxococcota bacterium]
GWESVEVTMNFNLLSVKSSNSLSACDLVDSSWFRETVIEKKLRGDLAWGLRLGCDPVNWYFLQTPPQ